MSQANTPQPETSGLQSPFVIEVTGICSLEDVWHQLESAAKLHGRVEEPGPEDLDV